MKPNMDYTPYLCTDCRLMATDTVEASVKLALRVKGLLGQGRILGVGAMYAASTQTDAQVVSMEKLWAIREVARSPGSVAGRINRDTLEPFKGIDGLAVVSMVVAQQDIRTADQELASRFKEGQDAISRCDF